MLDTGFWICPPTQVCPQITQIDADISLFLNLRYLRDLRERRQVFRSAES
jgi:hypothetical protein